MKRSEIILRKYAWVLLVTFPLLLTACSPQPQVSEKPSPPVGYENYDSITLDITEIGSDHFKGKLPWPYPCEYTVNLSLGEEYCVGDRVDVYYSDLKEVGRTAESSEWTAQVNAVYVQPSSFELDPNMAYKPVIYLYPKQETSVSVKLDYKGTLTHTWPLYQNGWEVTAMPDGTLHDASGRNYPYLFWEGTSNTNYDMSHGFCIKGSNSEMFLQESLVRLGLNAAESAEFMEFWLPYLEKNPYNLISFQGTPYIESAELSITPKPDTIIRVFMAFTPLQEAIEIPPQEFIPPERLGFTVVEWGGALAPQKN